MPKSGPLPRWIWVAALLAWFLAVPSGPDSWSDGSRLATVESLLHRGTFAIDESPWAAVGDRIEIDGSFRSHQPPLLAVLALPIAALVEAAGFKLSPANSQIHLLLIIALLSAAPFAIFVWRASRTLPAWRNERRWIAPALLCASFATPYATVFNAHLPAACCVGFALLHLRQSRSALAIGLWLGLAVALEPVALGFAAVAGVSYLARGEAWRARLGFAVGLLPGLISACILQWLATGSLQPGGLESSAFAWPNSAFLFEARTGELPARGVAATWVYFLRGTVWNYGLFAYHPWMLLGLAGTLWSASRSESSPTRSASRVALFGSLSVLATYTLLSANHGGACYGVRWFLLIVPALVLFTDTCPLPRARGWFSFGLSLLLTWSLFFTAVGAIAPFSRWNPFVLPARAGESASSSPLSFAIDMLHEGLRVRALGPRFDERYLEREYRLGLEHRLRFMEREGNLVEALAIDARLALGAESDHESRARAALAIARLWRARGDAASAWHASRAGLNLQPGEPRLLLLACEVASIDLGAPAWAARERAALERLLEDRIHEPEEGWNARAAAMLRRGISSRFEQGVLPGLRQR